MSTWADEWWDRQDPPAGAEDNGTPRQPPGGFTVEAADLIAASVGWDEVSEALKRVSRLASEGTGHLDLFGSHDALSVNAALHDSFNQSVVRAALDGGIITASIADGLVEVANDYSGTDTTTGDNFREFRVKRR